MPACPLDISVLALLCSAAEQDDQQRPVPTEVDPLPGPKFDFQLANTLAHGLHVRRVSTFETTQRDQNLRRRSSIKPVKPFGVRRPVSGRLVLPKLNHPGHRRAVRRIVPQTLPYQCSRLGILRRFHAQRSRARLPCLLCCKEVKRYTRGKARLNNRPKAAKTRIVAAPRYSADPRKSIL
jgi:hypothetical protein